MDSLTDKSPMARNAYISMARTTPRFRRPSPIGRFMVLISLWLAYSLVVFAIGFVLRGAV